MEVQNTEIISLANPGVAYAHKYVQSVREEPHSGATVKVLSATEISIVNGFRSYIYRWIGKAKERVQVNRKALKRACFSVSRNSHHYQSGEQWMASSSEEFEVAEIKIAQKPTFTMLPIERHFESRRMGCGCFDRIFSTPGQEDISLWHNKHLYYGTDYVKKVLRRDGFKPVDACYCPKQDESCQDCRVLNCYLLNIGECHCDEDDFFDALRQHEHFSFTQYEDIENEENITCVKYLGPYSHERIIHLVSNTNEYMCPCRNMSRSFGISVDNKREQVYYTREGVTSLQMLSFFQCFDKLERVPRVIQRACLLEALKRYDSPLGMAAPVAHIPFARNSMKRMVVSARADTQTSQDTPELARNMTQDVASNVDMTDTTQESVSMVAIQAPTIGNFIQDLPVSLSSLTDRWVKFANLSWNTTQPRGAILATYDMPLLMLSANPNCPNTLLFNQYAYFKCSIEVEFKVNTVAGQSGQLIVGAMYNALADTTSSIRIIDSYQLAQMPNIKLNAAGSNTGKMEVPWCYQFPVAPTRNMGVGLGSYYFTLFVGVTAPLRVGGEGLNSADVTAYGRFKNIEFFGQRTYLDVVPRGLLDTVGSAARTVGNVASSVGALVGHPEIKFVESLLSKVLGKSDNDRPQDPREPNNFYLQQNTSLSLGTGTNKIKLLQLLHDNTTPHPSGLVPDGEQYSTEFIKSCFGYINPFTWSDSQVPGTVIFSIPVSPMQGFTPGTASALQPNMLPTPLSALGMYYGGYHGDILLRVTFCISKFHSGRIAIVYVPDGTAPALTLNPSCYYGAQVDVQDQSVYTFKIPYQIPTLYAPLHTFSREWTVFNDAGIPGQPTTQYPCYGNVYFVVINSLRSNQTASNTIDVLVEQAGSDNFHYVYPMATQFPVINTTNPGLVADPRGDTGTNSDRGNDERKKTVTEKKDLVAVQPMWFTSLNERFEVRDVCKRYTTIYRLNSCAALSGTTTPDHLRWANIAVYHVPVVPANSIDPILTPVWRSTAGNPMFDKSYMVAHERVNLATNNTISFRVPWASPMAMIANGLDPTLTPNGLVGYCNGRVHVEIITNAQSTTDTIAKPQHVVLSFDVTAGTLSVRNGTEATEYNLLDFQSWMHESFRYFRGDLNFQIDILPYARNEAEAGWDFVTVINRALGDTASFYVFQGFPWVTRRLGNPIQMLTSSTITRTGNSDQAVLANRQWIRDLTMEGIEPNPGPIFSKNMPETENNLGYLHRVITAVQSKMSLSRDFMLKQLPRISRLVILAIAAQLSFGLVVALVCDHIYNDLYPQIRTAVTNVETATQEFRKTTSTVGEAAHNVKNATGVFGPDTNYDKAAMLVKIASVITNVYNTSGVLQTCLTLAAFFSDFKIVHLATDKILQVFGYASETEVDPRSDGVFEDTACAESWISLLISGLLGAMGLAINYGGSSKEYVRVAADFFRNGVTVKKFVEMHFNLFETVTTWVKKKLGLEGGLVSADAMAEEMIVWMQSVNYYCQSYNSDAIIENAEVALKILELKKQSETFDLRFSQTKEKIAPCYFQYRNKLNAMVDLLSKGGVVDMVRPVPFCTWLYGAAGVGKTVCADEILAEQGRIFGVSSNHPVYHVTSDAKYWNNYRQQRLLCFPDFGRITGGEELRKEVLEFMNVVDSWPYNPNFAELEDKRRIVCADAVVVCSNHCDLPLQNINFTETKAFKRRRHLLVKVLIPPSVVTLIQEAHNVNIAESGHPQADLVPAEFMEAHGEFAHLRFIIHDGDNPIGDANQLTWEQFKDVMREKAISHRAKQLALCAKQKQRFRDLIPGDVSGRVNELPRRLAREVDARGEYDDYFDHIIDDCIERHTVPTPTRFIKFKRENFSGPTPWNRLECGCSYFFHSDTSVVYYETTCLRLVRSDYVSPEEPDEGWVEWQGYIPSLSAARAFTQDFTRDTFFWHEVSPECPHNEYVLSAAYYQVFGGEVMLCVDGECVTYVIPPYCHLPAWTRFKAYKKGSGRADHAVPYRSPGYLSPSKLFGPLKCAAHPGERANFALSNDVLKIRMRGTQVGVDDADTQADLLNKATMFPPDVRPEERRRRTFQHAMTFCWYQREELGEANDYRTVLKGLMWRVASVLGVVLTFVVMVRTVSRVYKTWKTMNASPQAYGGPNVAHTKNTVPPKTSQNVVVSARGQEDVVERMVQRNTITIKRGNCTLEGLRLCSQYVLCPAHIAEEKGDYLIELSGSMQVFKPHEIRRAMFATPSGSNIDLAILKIPIPAAYNIVGHFLSEQEMHTLRSTSAIMYKKQDATYRRYVEIKPCQQEVIYRAGALSGPVNVNGYSFEDDTMHYRCGAVLVSNSKICGMYVADNRSLGVGFASGVTKQVIQAGLEALGATHYDMKIHRDIKQKPGISNIEIANNMIPLSVIDNNITYSGKTNIVPGPHTGIVSGPYLFPADQRGSLQIPGVGVVQAGVHKQVRPIGFKPGSFAKVCAFFCAFFLNFRPKLVNKKPFSVETAIRGIEGDTDFPSMNLNTALGWPVKDLYPNGFKKNKVIDKERGSMDSKLVEYYTEHHSKRRNLDIPDTAFMDFPKDETLKPDKATRLINGSPVDHFIDMRRYLWHFFVSLRGVKSGISVGLNVHSSDWASMLSTIEDPIDEDYSNFGYSLHSEIIEAIRHLALEWHKKYTEYTEEDLGVIYCLFEELRCSIHVASNLKYAVLCGSPSGAFGTDMINSLANIFYHMYSHFETFGNFDNYHQERIIVYGDDVRRNRVRTHEQFKKSMEDLGMKVSLEKGGRGTFLKRSVNIFKQGDKYYALAPLPPHVVVDMLHWVRKPFFSKEEAFEQRLEAFMTEIFHYGRMTYDETVSMLRLKIPDLTFNFKDYDIFLEGYSPLSREELLPLSKLDVKFAQFNLCPLFFSDTMETKEMYDNSFHAFCSQEEIELEEERHERGPQLLESPVGNP